jgi:hypothetical protein
VKFTIYDLRFAILAALFFFQCAACTQAQDILTNGDFEKTDAADPARPAGWDRVDGLGVQWTQSPGDAHGRAICMDTRFSEQAMQAQWTKTGLTNIWNIPKPGKNAVAETYGLSLYSAAMPVKPGQAYRITFVDCHAKDDGWTTQSQIFHPTKFRPDVTEIKVMLFAYYPAGVYWFDNIHLEPVADTATK